MIPFFFTIGGQDFSSKLKGFENDKFYCPHCHNNSVDAIKQRSFFTFCYIPLIPTHWGPQLKCSICNWSQETSVEAVQNMHNNLRK